MRSATSELLPWAMFANGPQCIRHGWPSSVWIRFGFIAAFRSTVIPPAAPPASGGQAREPLAQVVDVAGDGHDRHALRRRGDVEAGLARVAVQPAAQADHGVA